LRFFGYARFEFLMLRGTPFQVLIRFGFTIGTIFRFMEQS
jgi:hypothetical protein